MFCEYIALPLGEVDSKLAVIDQSICFHGSVMIRRESERSNDEDTVFHKEDPSSPVAATTPVEPISPKSPKSFKDEPPKVVVPAPPPKENAWARRKDNVVSPRSSTGGRTSSSSESAKEPTSPREQAGGHQHEDREKRRSSGDGRGTKPVPKKPIEKKQEKSPRKPADMPKFEEPKPKDWTQKNMFSGLEEEQN
ncbi:hypothetical protein BSL78_16285 [Apostichopus japonicus]|uniref:Uncharacterized protein n=1 Tax=Stichopus japonicus TaxID=307972 RepID=A0A2G8KFU1_STIJA|nr:hypothetical protein BSL78_16285 [Apostichopus japonicus]